MSEYFGDNKEEQKIYIPPNYEEEGPKDDDPDDSDGEISEDIDSDEDQADAEAERIINEQNQERRVVTTPFGSGQTNQPSSPFGTTPTFGGGFGQGQSSTPIWQRNNTPSWGQPSGGSAWGVGNQQQKAEIDRTKKYVFCDFLDCVVEPWDSTGRPGYLPRDIYDLKPRFEVWSKIQAFNPQMVFPMIPINLIPNTTGAEGWLKTLEYFCYSLSAFLRIRPEMCRILAQTVIGQEKEELMKSVLNGTGLNVKDAIYIGIYSGLAGQSNRDQLAAANCGMDYVDLGVLLNNMY